MALPLLSLFPDIGHGHHLAEGHPISGPWAGDREELDGAGAQRLESQPALGRGHGSFSLAGSDYLPKSAAAQEGNFSRD